jgi:hypothetical protein
MHAPPNTLESRMQAILATAKRSESAKRFERRNAHSSQNVISTEEPLHL